MAETRKVQKTADYGIRIALPKKYGWKAGDVIKLNQINENKVVIERVFVND